MMKQGLIIGVALLGLAGCSTGAARSFDDPAVQRLLTMATPEYYAARAVASQVAQGCARYSYDAVLDEQLDDARNEAGRGSLSALSLRRAIDLETDVAQRSFEAKHSVSLRGSDLCPAADAEALEGTPLSALLVPV